MEPADRATKLRRLDDLHRRVPAVSANVLEQILRNVKSRGVPRLVTHQAMSSARSMIASSTPHGHISSMDVNAFGGARTLSMSATRGGRC